MCCCTPYPCPMCQTFGSRQQIKVGLRQHSSPLTPVKRCNCEMMFNERFEGNFSRSWLEVIRATGTEKCIALGGTNTTYDYDQDGRFIKEPYCLKRVCISCMHSILCTNATYDYDQDGRFIKEPYCLRRVCISCMHSIRWHQCDIRLWSRRPIYKGSQLLQACLFIIPHGDVIRAIGTKKYIALGGIDTTHVQDQASRLSNYIVWNVSVYHMRQG